MSRVLFVCSGNICRSPTAEGVLRKRVEQVGLNVEVDSAGTHGYHAGEPPDPRAIKAAAARGYDIAKQRARRLHSDDYNAFDLLLALDAGHLHIMRKQCPPEHLHKLRLLMSYAPALGVDEVPDPYYGPVQGFDQVLGMIESAVDGLVQDLQRQD